MTILIIGRTASGKDTLAHMLCRKGLTQVLSATTRPPRYDGENTHRFISVEEAAATTGKVAVTHIAGNEYFATRDDVETHDIYIIDPAGLYMLTKAMPDYPFVVVYVRTDRESAKKRFLARTTSETAENDWEKRISSEDRQFSEFEEMLDREDTIAPNVTVIAPIDNTGDLSILEQAAEEIYHFYRLHKNVRDTVLPVCKEHDVLHLTEDGRIILFTEDEDGMVQSTPMSDDMFAMEVSKSGEGLGRLCEAYFAHV